MNFTTWIKSKKIGVLYGGRSSEREISLSSGKAVLSALKGKGINAFGIDVGEDLPFQLKKQKIDFAYIALHGPWGEDGTVQGMLEMMGIPYSGSGVLASAVAMDKVSAKYIFDASGLPTPRWWILEKSSRVPSFSFPVVVKPSAQGSAIGVSIVKNKRGLTKALSAAFRFGRRALVERYVPGTEITVGILGDRPLPVIEIVPKNEFYDFESKYTPGCSQHLMPPRLPKKTIVRAQRLALEAFRVIGCRAVSRVDMIVDKDQNPLILEINTIPGMTETSLLPDSALAAGIDFPELVLSIIKNSLQ